MKRASTPVPSCEKMTEYIQCGLDEEDQPLPIPRPIDIDSSTYCMDHESDSDTDSEEEDSDSDEDPPSNIMDDDDDDADMLDDDEVIEATVFRLSYHYLFVSRIYGHTSSVVYRCIDKRTKQRVAVKIKRRNSAYSDPMEVRVMSKIGDHKHCPSLEAFYRFPFSCAIVTKLYAEHSIRKTVWDDPTKIKRFMRQLLEALAFMHEHGIIYRDVKLSNLLWNDDTEELIIIDYDLSTFKRKQGHDRYAGTEGYESPEMMVIDKVHGETKSTYDEKIDIWSAGVVLGQLIHKCSEMDVSRERAKKWAKRARKLKEKCPLAKQVMVEMLIHKAENRASAKKLLTHAYFTT